MLRTLTEKTMYQTQLPPNSNFIDYSVISEFRAASAYHNFSIKYVVAGSEMYYANGNKYYVGSKEYLIANKHCEGYVEIESRQPATGICIEISHDLLSEVVAGYLRPDTPILDLDLDRFFNTNSFLENKYAAGKTNVGKFLLDLDSLIASRSNKNIQFNTDFYFFLAEEIIKDHIPLFKHLQQIKAIKNDTKKDLVRKLLLGKNYIESSFSSSTNIAEVAKQSGLSEYHFFRLFKEVFEVSPHQFLIQQRLLHAKKMLEAGNNSISSLALETGFADVHSFSKSFKKHFGFSPSKL
jgi:AraC family transcriptional regulator